MMVKQHRSKFFSKFKCPTRVSGSRDTAFTHLTGKVPQKLTTWKGSTSNTSCDSPRLWHFSPSCCNNGTQQLHHILWRQCLQTGIFNHTIDEPCVCNVQSRLAITRLAITRFGYNAVGRGPRISAARGEMGATANNNAVINCHLCLWNPHVCLVQVYLETI